MTTSHHLTATVHPPITTDHSLINTDRLPPLTTTLLPGSPHPTAICYFNLTTPQTTSQLSTIISSLPLKTFLQSSSPSPSSIPVNSTHLHKDVRPEQHQNSSPQAKNILGRMARKLCASLSLSEPPLDKWLKEEPVSNDAAERQTENKQDARVKSLRTLTVSGDLVSVVENAATANRAFKGLQALCVQAEQVRRSVLSSNVEKLAQGQSESVDTFIP
jgi:hypothetical protein